MFAFQPKEPAKRTLAAKEFAQEMQRKESYFSLLPPDLKQKIKKDIYPGRVEDEITAIRKKYLTSSGPEIVLKFLNDEAFNQEIIDNLMQIFDIPPHEKTSITIMLNTPASFKIAYKSIKDIPVSGNFRNFYLAYQEYIRNVSFDCEELINYTHFFELNMKELAKQSLKIWSDWDLGSDLIKSFQKLEEEKIQEQIDDIKWILQQRLNFEASKEGEWTCAVQ